MAYSTETKSPVIAMLCNIVAALNPASLWQALQEADEGVCLMAPVRVRNDRRR